MNELKIKSAWVKLFSHFHEVMDDSRKMKVIDIKRKSNKIMLEDIIAQLKVVDASGELEMFAMPWNYKIEEFETETEKRNRLWEEEKTNEHGDKFDAFEKKIEEKHKILVNQLEMWSASIVKLVQPSYANATALQSRNNGGGQVRGPAVDLPHPHVQVPIVPVVTLTPPVNAQFEAGRERLGSASGIGNQKKKGVVGTSNSSTSGRKMKSPPADIFVWGVHPDTTLEDIVNDLAESDIKIETKDVLKKSRDDAPLNSYRISVQASDLQKALNPEIWPLRVKVREYIYYAKRATQHRQNGAQASNQQQPGQQCGQQHGQ